MKSLKQYFIQYFSNDITALIYLGLIVLTIAPISYLIIIGVDTRFLLEIMIRMIVYYMILFGVSGYLYLNKDKRNGLNELFQAYTKDSHSFLKKASLVLFLLLTFYFFLLFSILFINASIRKEFYVLNWESIKAFFYLVMIPGYFFLILTLLISFLMNTRVSMSLYILIALVSSPLLETFETKQNTLFPINELIQIIYFPLNLFVYHGEVTLDTLYGYQTEFYKLGIVFIWIGVLIYIYNYKKIRIKRLLIMPLVLSIISLSYIRLNTSTLRISDSSLTSFHDMNYYQKLNDMNNDYGYQKVDDSISRYDLNFIFHNQMKVNGSFIINTKTSESTLTLYHKYKIKELTSKNLKDYKREGDYIYLTFKHPVNNEKIMISYQGFSDKFYSSNKAICLPSYFPYYPFIGKQNIYSRDKNLKFTNYGYNIYLRQNAYYHITSNLPLYISSNNTYADNLTLLYGNMNKKDGSIFVNSYPLELSYFVNNQEIEDRFKNSINRVKSNIKNKYNIDIKELDKKVIFLPKSINFSEANPDISINSTYLLTSQRNLDERDYLSYRLFNNRQINDVLKYALLVSNNNLKLNDYYEELINQLKARPHSDQYVQILENNTKKYSRKDTLNKLGKLIFEDAIWNSQFKN